MAFLLDPPSGQIRVCQTVFFSGRPRGWVIGNNNTTPPLGLFKNFYGRSREGGENIDGRSQGGEKTFIFVPGRENTLMVVPGGTFMVVPGGTTKYFLLSPGSDKKSPPPPRGTTIKVFSLLPSEKWEEDI